MKNVPRRPKEVGSMSVIADAILKRPKTEIAVPMTASHEFMRRRASKGNGAIKQARLKELRECELDMDHLVILTTGKHVDPKHQERREQTEAMIKDLIKILDSICLPVRK